jgi:tripartite-type tricarboxylate transporter receptor subunit TctC
LPPPTGEKNEVNVMPDYGERDINNHQCEEEKMKRTGKIGLFGAALLCLILTGPSFTASAADFPDRQIEVVIPLDPGGGTDQSFAPFKEKVQKILGQPIVISYKPGAGAAIGAAYVAKAKPDGYTLLFGNAGSLLTTPVAQNVGYTINDFVPIACITNNPSIFIVKDDSPYKTFKDWLEAAKKKKMTFSTPGHMSPPHLVMGYFQRELGFTATHIPEKGTVGVNTAVLGGHSDLGVCVPMSTMLVKGKLRGIAMSSEKRSALFPEVPTLVELGFPLFKDLFGAASWLWAPKDTPKENINKIYAAFKKINDEEGAAIAQQLGKIDLQYHFMGPEEMMKYAQNEIVFYKKFMSEMGTPAK